MPAFAWRKRPTRHFGEVFVPFVQLQLSGPSSKFITLSAQLDSGAVITLLRRSVANLLGVEFEGGAAVSLGGVGGSEIKGRRHSLLCRFGADSATFHLDCVIAESEHVPNLVGRVGFFQDFQVAFDPTLEHTVVNGRWLSKEDKEILDYYRGLDKELFGKLPSLGLSEPLEEVVRRILSRAAELVHLSLVLRQAGRPDASPLVVRPLIELYAEFCYILQDESRDDRAQLFLDYGHVERFKRMTAWKKVTGNASAMIANSPRRPEGELQLKADYERVRHKFLVKKHESKSSEIKKTRDSWHGQKIADLCRLAGIEDEYEKYYADWSMYVHGTPLSMSVRPPGADDMHFFALSWYSRIILLYCDKCGVILTAEQSKNFQAFSKPMT